MVSWPSGLSVAAETAAPSREVGQAGLGVVLALRGVVDVLDVGLEEAVEGDRATAGAEDRVAAVGGGAADADRHRVADRVLHLRGDGAHPDQLVEPELLARQAGLGGRAERLAGRADRLVRLLGVLHLGGVGARGVGEVLGAVQLAHLVARRADRGARERRGVGTHVGDEAVLVEPLRDRHRHAGAHPELAAGLLLQRGGAEGRRTASGGRAWTRPSGRRTSCRRGRWPATRRRRGRGGRARPCP